MCKISLKVTRRFSPSSPYYQKPSFLIQSWPLFKLVNETEKFKSYVDERINKISKEALEVELVEDT